MKNPKITVIIPAHNEDEIILDCLNSVASNNYKNKEVIVVNDGSTDKTQKLVEDFSKKHKYVKLINYEKGHSAAFARNRGAENANGDIFIFLDADTVVNSIFLEEISKNYLVADGFSTMNVSLKTKILPKILSAFVGPSDKLNLENGTISDSPGFVKPMFFAMSAKAYRKIGGYDEEIFYYEDEDLTKRFYDSGFKSVLVKNAIQSFELPADLGGFYRQCKWIGFGTNTIKDTQLKKSLFKSWTLKFFYVISPLLFLFNKNFFFTILIANLLLVYLSLVKRNHNPLISIFALPFFYIKTALVFFGLISKRKKSS